MIYFKISSVIVESDDTNLTIIMNTVEYSLIVKIGYTDDNIEISRSRDLSYRTENPSIIHYKYIPGGTKEDESMIHIYLKDYLYAGREWFRLTPEVIEFIELVNTIEDIKRVTYSSIIYNDIKNLDKEITRNYQEKSKVLKYLVPSIIEVIYKDIKNIIPLDVFYITELEFLYIKYPDNYETDVLNVIDREALDYSFKIREEYFSRKNAIISSEVNEILEEFESKTTFIEKMKYLCLTLDSPFLDKESINMVLKQIDSIFYNYYTILGIKRISELSYRHDRLEKEYKKLTLIKK